MSASEKLAEARFFLELLDALESRNSPLTRDATCEKEASYLLSAILNALYSALEQAKPIIGVDALKKYKDENTSIFKGKGGLRNITVHDRHVSPDFSGYIPPAPNAVNFDMRAKPKLIEEVEEFTPDGVIKVTLGSSHYVDLGTGLKDLTELCFEQFYRLREFLRYHEVIT
ncbi:hypothetical protein [Marinobacterium sp. MBR-109]|jgi:hypothetical protein|uniref:hypothetical protein n=1 Tax=Marinobacterium sp. MBR-109 TaxID=3156462 RepID=UPI003392B814